MIGETMQLWAIVPELVIAGAILLLLPLAPFLSPKYQFTTTVATFVVLIIAAILSIAMWHWRPQLVFGGTYAVDPFAVFFKVYAIGTTVLILSSTVSRYRGRPHEATVPVLLLLVVLGMVGLAASNDLVLIVLFLQITTVGSYILVGLEKQQKLAREGALKLFLFSSASAAVMLFGAAFIFGLTGSLRLTEIASKAAALPPVVVFVIVALLLAGYAYKITAVPFHAWAPDTYQGAATPITAFLSVAPKAAGIAVLGRTVMAGFAANSGSWAELIAVLAAVTMTAGNFLALRQTSAKRLLAYSSIAQAGYVLVGVAAAERDRIALPSALLYLTVYLFMNLGAFLAVDAVERIHGSDDVATLRGLGRAAPLVALVLTISALSLAGLPPFGGFVGKTALFAAALAVRWNWLAVLLAVNTAVSLYYYVRLIAPMYLESTPSSVGAVAVPLPLRAVLVLLALGSTLTGIWPGVWMDLALHGAQLIGA